MSSKYDKYDQELERIRQDLERNRLRDEKIAKILPIAEFIYGVLVTLLMIAVIRWLW